MFIYLFMWHKTNFSRSWMFLFTHKQIHMHTCTHASTHVRICASVHVHTHACVCACVHACGRVCVLHACTRVHVHTYTTCMMDLFKCSVMWKQNQPIYYHGLVYISLLCGSRTNLSRSWMCSCSIQLFSLFKDSCMLFFFMADIYLSVMHSAFILHLEASIGCAPTEQFFFFLCMYLPFS